MNEWIKKSSSNMGDYHACNCVGPQNGNPLCPCMMRGLKIIDGRYVRVIDFGPVKNIPHEGTIK